MTDIETVRIMVIDNDRAVLDSMNMILKIKDYEVDLFEDGEKAIAQLKRGQYDVAFVDYKLSGINGIEVLKKIKHIDSDIEVVIITAYACENSQAHAITFGALEYLHKPFLMEEIYGLVDRALRKRKQKELI